MSGKNEKMERLIARAAAAERQEGILRSILSMPEFRRDDLFLWSRELLAKFHAAHQCQVQCPLCTAYQDFLKEANR